MVAVPTLWNCEMGLIVGIALILVAGGGAIAEMGAQEQPRAIRRWFSVFRIEKARWRKVAICCVLLLGILGIANGILEYRSRRQLQSQLESAQKELARITSEMEQDRKAQESHFVRLMTAVKKAKLAIHEELPLDLFPTADPVFFRGIQRIPPKLFEWCLRSGDPLPLLQYLLRELDVCQLNETVMRNEEISTIALFVGEMDIAENALKRILERSPRRLLAWNQLGTLHLNRSKFKEAESYFKRILEFASQEDEENPRVVAAAHANLSVLYSRTKKLEAAYQHNRAALEIYESTAYAPGQARAYGRLAIIERQRGNRDVAIAWHQKALRLHRDHGDHEGVARELSGLANAHLKKGDKESLQIAEKYACEAVGIETRLHRPLGIAKDTATLGAIQLMRRDLDAAEETLRRALTLLSNLDNPNDVASVRLSLGILFAERGDISAARREMTEARDIFLEIGQEENAEVVKTNLAKLPPEIGP